MNFTDTLNQAVGEAFLKAGYDPALGRVSVSNRPDLAEYQCNGAMAAAKVYHKAPIVIAEQVAEALQDSPVFSKAEAVKPGFINLDLREEFLIRGAAGMAEQEKFGLELPDKQTVMVDYGGANVAKPLHIGHLRSAIIGEAIKRIKQYMGHEVIGDAHLGDWGLQFGLIIEELRERKPELPYFDESFDGDFPEEAPFTLSELEEIYPAASARSKADPDFLERAHRTTFRLQQGDKAYRALWKHINEVSIADLRKNYDRLDVHFDLWKAESDADPYIHDMVEDLKQQGLAYLSNGALVVDVQEEGDKHELPPCLIMKSDGAALYATTDLATLVWRMRDYHPDHIIYLADKRQDLHYTQFFRVAKKAGIVLPETVLSFIGFGTMNGRDGKPFKTRAGGVMRLEDMIEEVRQAVFEKMKERYDEDEVDPETVNRVTLAAIKYGDLQNQATKDYIFDIDRFASFEGNTGPYILYSIVRIKSILNKGGIQDSHQADLSALLRGGSAQLKSLLITLNGFSDMILNAAEEMAPHKICSYIYQLCDAFNSFYHETPVLKEEDTELKNAYLSLLILTKRILTDCIWMLGFEAPDRM